MSVFCLLSRWRYCVSGYVGKCLQ